MQKNMKKIIEERYAIREQSLNLCNDLYTNRVAMLELV